VQPVLNQGRAVGWRAPPAHERGEAFAQRGVESLNVGGVDGRPAVAGRRRCNDGRLRPHDDAPHDPLAPVQARLNHLDQHEARRPDQRRPAAPPRPLRHTDEGPRGGDVRGEAIHGQEERPPGERGERAPAAGGRGGRRAAGRRW